jgi:outer membrane protein assembly factor BamB
MKHFLLLPLFLLSAAVCADDLSPSRNWPEFRGPNGSGVAPAASKPPVKWSEREQVKWKTAIHGKGWSSPVVWGEQVWLTTAPEDGKELFAVCVDARSGSIVHDIKVFEVAKPEFCHPTNSYASCSPVVEAGRVYVHFGSYGTACLDTATGKKIWERRDLPCDHFRGPGSSPIIVGDLVVLSFDGIDVQYLAALDKATGRTVWKKERGTDFKTDNGDYKKAYSTPGVFDVNGRLELVSPGAMTSYAYDLQTGEDLWSIRHGGMNAAARVLHGAGQYFFTTGDGGAGLIAVPDKGGRERKATWSLNKTIPKRGSPVLVGELLFMAADNGIITCLEAATGTQVWQKRHAGNFWSSPVAADGRVYFANQEGVTYVIRAGREYELLAENKLDAGCTASPAVMGNALILRTRTHLYRVEK